MSVSKLQLRQHVRGRTRVVDATNLVRLQLELARVRNEIKSLEDIERRLGGALKNWDREARAGLVGHSRMRPIEPFPTIH